MARYDKYDPISGGSRYKLEADWAKADEGIPFGVSLNANGRLIKGTAGTSGLIGVLVVDKTAGTISNKKAGDIVDVMRNGEIVEVTSPALAKGITVYVAASGALSAGATGDLAVGNTTDDATRVVISVTKGAKA